MRRILHPSARRPSSLLVALLAATVLLGGCDLDDDDDAPIDLGSSFDVIAAAGSQSSPDVAFSTTSDEHLVVFMDAGDVRGALVSDDGLTVSSAFDINTNGNLKANPRVAWASSSNLFLVVWDEDDGGEFDVMGQMVDPTGPSLSGGVVNVTDDHTDDQRRPALAYSPGSNIFLVAWEDNRSGAGDILAQALSGADASDVGTTFFVGDDPEPEGAPDVAFNPSRNELLVVFERDDGTGIDEIWGRRVDAATQSNAAADFLVDFDDTPGTAHDLEAPAVIYSEDSDLFGVAYVHDDADSDAWIALIEDDGPFVDRSFVGIDLDDREPAIGWHDPGEEFLVLWDFDDGVDRQLGGRLIDDAGGGTSARFRVAGGSGDQFDGAVSRDPTLDRFLLVWEDDGDIRGRIAD